MEFPGGPTGRRKSHNALGGGGWGRVEGASAVEGTHAVAANGVRVVCLLVDGLLFACVSRVHPTRLTKGEGRTATLVGGGRAGVGPIWPKGPEQRRGGVPNGGGMRCAPPLVFPRGGHLLCTCLSLSLSLSLDRSMTVPFPGSAAL